MSIVEELSGDHIEHEIRDSVRIARDAELNGEPMQNGKKRDVEVSKNTHFEFQFGGDESHEVYAYIERYEPGEGLEVMLWADEEWFGYETFGLYGPSVEDGGEELERFANELLELVADELDKENVPQFEYHQHAPPSVVFSTVFSL